MRILLDECVPRRLARDLPFEVQTVPAIAHAGLKNGDLLRAVCHDYDVFLTLDQNLQYQQNLADFPIGIIVVCARSNRYDDILPFVPEIVSALDRVVPGNLVVLRR